LGAERIAERIPGAVALRVHADLALGDHRALVVVQEFDRVLEREDMSRRIAVAVVDHRRQGGRLTGARGAHHNDQAVLLHDQVVEYRGRPSSSTVGISLRT
jgi:hypothetical protein